MRIQYCSDLHIEFKDNEAFLKRRPIPATGEILLLAGDIMPFAEMSTYKDFISYLSDHFSMVYWLPGNHEYYQSDILPAPGPLLEKVRDNVFIVNNQQVQYKNVNLVFSTLWSHIKPVNESLIDKVVADFSQIKTGDNKFTPAHFNSLHASCMKFLESAVNNKPAAGETIIVTHHVPTLLNYPNKYKNSPVNEAFVVELFPFIESCGAAYWIFGHHHKNLPAFTIGNTQLLTNQLGYIERNEQRRFRQEAVIEIPGI